MDKKEFWAIAIAVILMTLILSFYKENFYTEKLLSNFLISLIIISISIFAKKLVAHKIDVEINHKILELRRYWIGTSNYLKNPLPIGIIFPLILSFISTGIWRFLTFLEYTTKALPAKAVKKYGRGRFSNVNEWDDAIIAFYGICAVFLIAIIAKIALAYNLSTTILPLNELARYALYYGIFNMIPFGLLDGNKIFFGSRALYVFSLILIAITGLIVFF
jgi:Zn-dependent protease